MIIHYQTLQIGSMNKTYKILVIVGLSLAVLLTLVIFIRDNIKDNISGSLVSFNLKNIRGILPTIADIEVNFDITNNSWFNFTIKDLKVRIFDSNSGTYLTENQVKKDMYLPKGLSRHEIILNDNNIASDLNEFLQGNAKYLAIVEFKVLGVRVEFEQQLEL